MELKNTAQQNPCRGNTAANMKNQRCDVHSGTRDPTPSIIERRFRSIAVEFDPPAAIL